MTPAPPDPHTERAWRDQELLRGADDLLVDFDRGFKLFKEFVGGCRELYDIGRAVTIFGSARFPEDHRYYELARALGRGLAGAGYAVITGGGPGIMEAANRGAKEGGGPRPGRHSILSRDHNRPEQLMGHAPPVVELPCDSAALPRVGRGARATGGYRRATHRHPPEGAHRVSLPVSITGGGNPLSQ